jgi:hypothetical protein
VSLLKVDDNNETMAIDPARIIEAREILNTMPVDFILDTPLDGVYERQGTGMSNAERVRRSRARREVRAQFDM